MESKIATLEMLDEVTADMRLEYPGKKPFRPDPEYPERSCAAPKYAFEAIKDSIPTFPPQ